MEPSQLYPQNPKLDGATIIAVAIIQDLDPDTIPLVRSYRQIDQDIVLAFDLSNDIDKVQVRVKFRQTEPTPSDQEPMRDWAIIGATLNWPDVKLVNDEWSADALLDLCYNRKCWPNPPIAT